MRGTGSHDVRLTDVFVPSRRTFMLGPFVAPGSAFAGPLYKFHMWLGGPEIAAIGLGVARSASRLLRSSPRRNAELHDAGAGRPFDRAGPRGPGHRLDRKRRGVPPSCPRRRASPTSRVVKYARSRHAGPGTAGLLSRHRQRGQRRQDVQLSPAQAASGRRTASNATSVTSTRSHSTPWRRRHGTSRWANCYSASSPTQPFSICEHDCSDTRTSHRIETSDRRGWRLTSEG